MDKIALNLDFFVQMQILSLLIHEVIDDMLFLVRKILDGYFVVGSRYPIKLLQHQLKPGGRYIQQHLNL